VQNKPTTIPQYGNFVYNTGKNKNNNHSREQIQPVMHVVGTTLTKKNIVMD
jgi:hypothetical protein